MRRFIIDTSSVTREQEKAYPNLTKRQIVFYGELSDADALLRIHNRTGDQMALNVAIGRFEALTGIRTRDAGQLDRAIDRARCPPLLKNRRR